MIRSKTNGNEKSNFLLLLVFLIGIILITSGSLSTIHFAYAKKRSSTGSTGDTGTGGPGGTGDGGTKGGTTPETPGGTTPETPGGTTPETPGGQPTSPTTTCNPGEVQKDGKCIKIPPICPPGEHMKKGQCVLNRGCESINETIICTVSKTKTRYIGGGSGGSSSRLTQIPPNAADFPDNNVNAIQVHVATAKKDIIGSYHVTGEITNEGRDTLQFVQVTVHFYDSRGNLVAVSTCCYTTPSDIAAGHIATFDSFAMSNQISVSQ